MSIGDDTSVSPRHCRIKKEAQHYKIIDLESSSGTLINGSPVKEHVLQNGDQIKIGNSVFLFQLSGTESAAAPSSVIPEENTAEATIQSMQALPSRAQIARDLSAWLKATAVIHSISARVHRNIAAPGRF